MLASMAEKALASKAAEWSKHRPFCVLLLLTHITLLESCQNLAPSAAWKVAVLNDLECSSAERHIHELAEHEASVASPSLPCLGERISTWQPFYLVSGLPFVVLLRLLGCAEQNLLGCLSICGPCNLLLSAQLARCSS